ncbi:MAG: hypothetical protein HFI98_13780 [Lachnospiraceae bacterium]|nr:hypothetical protein [Lachnospiraceae bacterium]
MERNSRDAGLFLLCRPVQKLLGETDLSIHRRILIPTPHYIVFYNGLERVREEYIQKLSQSFENKGEGCIELTVRIININHGHNSARQSEMPWRNVSPKTF